MFLTLCFVLSSWVSFVRAVSPPNIITYQGRLLDANGVPVTATSASMIFELHTDPTASSCVWSNNSSSCTTPAARTVTLTDGLFSENLGDTTVGVDYAAINDSVFANNAALYLRVTVNGEPLSPRKRLTSSPYALNAENVDGYDTSLTGGSTSSFVPVTSSSGNLTLTGDPTGSTVSTGVVYVNPTTAAATETILGLAVNGTQAFRVTGDGDIETTGSLTFSDNTEIITLGELSITRNSITRSDALTIDVDSSTLNLNTTSSMPVNVGGAMYFNSGAATNALSFEGTSDDAFETIFAITNPTVSDRTVTFQNASGTVAYLSDLTGSSITLDTAYDAGGSGAGRTITADSGAVAISATSLGGNALLNVAHTASGTLTANTSDTILMSASRTLSSAATVTDNFDVFSLSRTSQTSNGSANLTAQGSVLALDNTMNQTLGTLTDSVTVLDVTQDTDSSGLAIRVNSGSSAFNGALAVGVLTPSSEAIADTAFVFDDGNDFYVHGDAGFNDDVYIDDQLNVDGHSTFGTEAQSAFVTVGVGESLNCTSNCVAVGGAMTHITTDNFSTAVIGGSFAAGSALAQNTAGTMLGVVGTAETSGAGPYAGTLVGTRGLVQRKSSNPTIATGFGVLGDVILDSVTNITARAAGLAGQVTLATNQAITGTTDLLYGVLTQSNGTFTALNGLDLVINPSGGTITTPKGIDLDVDPGTAGLFGAATTTTGIEITVDGNNFGSNNDVATVYGANISATNGTTGTTTAYGVYATASGADTNYSGYFYGNRFQVDDDGTANTPDTATGAGDVYAVGDIEADGTLRIDGGVVQVNNSGGDTQISAATTSGTSFAYLSVRGVDSGASGGNWQMYTASGAATISINGANNDLRWTTNGVSAGDDDEMRLTTAGQLFLDTGVGVGAADVAEVYVVSDPSLAAGDVVGLDAAGQIVKGASGNGTRLFGVVSTAPGVVLNNGEEDTITSNERQIALIGKVPVRARLESGAIAPGDPLAMSTTPGVATKAIGPGMILGFALEGYDGSGDNLIDVFVNVQWHSGDKIAADGSAVSITSDLVMENNDLVLRGVLESDSTVERDMQLRSVVTSGSEYRLSVKNTLDSEVAYVSDDGVFSVVGDVIVGAHLYPSDRGVPQTNRYIFYDGSSGPGGDFMRTNASGWATGSYDFAEMFPSDESLTPGTVVVFGSGKEKVAASSESYAKKLAGIVSTRPGFLAGDNKAGDYPIALAGRVPVNVSNENGAIEIGDPLTSSSTRGVAMKATEPGMVVGYALESFGGAQGQIVAFVNVGYWAGGEPSGAAQTASPNFGASLSSLDLSGDVFAGGNDILNVSSISGLGGTWEITYDGKIRTRGTLSTIVKSHQGEDKDVFASTSPEIYVTLAGTATLSEGRASVQFEKEDAAFNDVISTLAPIRVVATPNSSVPVFVQNKTMNGFDLVEVGGTSTGTTVDWYVVAFRKDTEPEKYLRLEVKETEETKETEEVEDVKGKDVEGVEDVEGVDVEEDEEMVVEALVEAPAVPEMPVAEPEPQPDPVEVEKETEETKETEVGESEEPASEESPPQTDEVTAPVADGDVSSQEGG